MLFGIGVGFAYSVATGDSGTGAADAACLANFPPYAVAGTVDEGLRVGPAIGLVGELAMAKVTVKGWPSHPLVDSFPIGIPSISSISR